jgi:purine-binding chemotaxis protein CheW
MTDEGEFRAELAGPAHWLLCSVGPGSCALPLDHVIEIMRMLPIERIAAAPPFILGVSIIRSQPVPVVHLGLLLGETRGEPARLVTVTVGGRPAALAVDAVSGVRSIDPAFLSDLPPLLRHAANDAVMMVGTLDAELLFLLEAGRLVPENIVALLETGATS